MKKKPQEHSRKPTLQKLELVPITDPVIQAALDKMRRQAKPVMPKILREFAMQKSTKKR